ncbi:acyl-CoA dehydrogenase family protein [Bradyrhizobium sp. NFR13]|uniref:acyl-CoA dehydrogenase family protein n=1 Tax=Bradyrhizobium sp. NFR13 TaxID=1566285 RepID=UPI000B86C464|nr:acyl-CoA dehydrogenase family protein [Bradyrhizobium sp. NFR13]
MLANCREDTAIFAPSERHKLLKNAQAFAAELSSRAFDTDRTADIAPDVWTDFRFSGLAMSPLPHEFGGSSLWDPRFGAELCAILRLLGGADLSLARIFEGHVNAAGWSAVTEHKRRSKVSREARVMVRCPQYGAPTTRKA